MSVCVGEKKKGAFETWCVHGRVLRSPFLDVQKLSTTMRTTASAGTRSTIVAPLTTTLTTTTRGRRRGERRKRIGVVFCFAKRSFGSDEEEDEEEEEEDQSLMRSRYPGQRRFDDAFGNEDVLPKVDSWDDIFDVSNGDDDNDYVSVRGPPKTCSEAAIEARNVLRSLRENRDGLPSKRVRVELPLPREDKGDEIVWLGLHGQAVDWRGGISERLAKTKVVVENMLSGYGFQYLGLLDKDADGMGLWTATEDMTVVAHPSDTTMQFFVNLLRGEYGKRVVNDQAHFLVVVNGFWSGNGEKVGQPWQFQLRKEAKEYLTNGWWEKVYSCRRTRSAAGIEGTLVRRYPEPWMLFDARGVHLLKQWQDEPSNREIAETLNNSVGQREAVGFNKDASETSREADVIT